MRPLRRCDHLAVPNDGHTSAPTGQRAVGLAFSEHVVTGRGEHSPAVVVGVVDGELVVAGREASLFFRRREECLAQTNSGSAPSISSVPNTK